MHFTIYKNLQKTKEKKGRQLGTYFASKAKAMMPATMGAETEVPVWPSVQRCRRSVVTCVTGW